MSMVSLADNESANSLVDVYREKREKIWRKDILLLVLSMVSLTGGQRVSMGGVIHPG